MKPDFVDRFYEASFLPELWPDILLDLARQADSKGGLLLSTREKSLNWTASDNIYDAFASYLSGGWFRRCGRRVCILEKAHSAFLREHDYWTEAELSNNEIYEEFFYPRDLGCSAGTGLVMPTGDHIVLSVERSHKKGPIEPAHMEMLNALRPHIARAAMIAARMGLQSARTAKDAFAKLQVPTILLNMDGKAIESSDDVSSLSDFIVWRANNQIVLKDKAADAMMCTALQELDSMTGIRSFAIRDDNDCAAFVAHIIPVCRTAHDIFAKGYALLVLNPINNKTLPSANLLRSLFDLTAAEANVARKLSKGESAEKISIDSGVSVNTVRTHIRKILEKTGCARTPELVSLLSNLSMQ